MDSSLLLVLLLLCTPLYTVGKSIPEQHFELRQSPQQLVDKWINAQPAGAVAVAVVSPEDTEYYFGGQLSSANPSLPNEHTLFEIGSITKAITGILLANQVLSGNVQLNDTLSKLLTDWPGRHSAHPGDVNLLELATHSSGLPREPDNLEPVVLPDNIFVNYTTKKMYEWLDRVKLSNRGSFLYSNAGAGLLGHALEVQRKQNYEDFLKNQVLIPLGLRDTTITLNSDQKSRLAPAHASSGEEIKNWDLVGIWAPAGGLRSTVAEMVRFVRLTTGLEAIPKEMGEALEFAIRVRKNTTLVSAIPTPKIGLFWCLSELPHETVLIWHGGTTGGHNAFVGWVPEAQIGIIVMASISSAILGKTVDQLASDLLKHVMDQQWK